ncbi:MAG: hypothetical protein ABIH83_03885 [Candidatus Micrarchaeota archaeon]
MNYTSHHILLSDHYSKNIEKTSVLVQEATFLYNYGAAQHNTTQTSDPLAPTEFTIMGYLRPDFGPTHNSLSFQRRSMLGLTSLSYHLSPPKTSNPNQICILRKMLDIEKNTQHVWVCGY